jgi:hypothetical protein
MLTASTLDGAEGSPKHARNFKIPAEHGGREPADDGVVKIQERGESCRMLMALRVVQTFRELLNSCRMSRKKTC